MISVLAVTTGSGCASSPPEAQIAVPADSVVLSSPTRIDTEPMDDDFWDTGASVEVDDDGRLLYASRVELVAGRGINETFHEARGRYDPNTVYIDPLTGRKIVLNRGPSAWRRVPRSVVAPPSERTISNAPSVSAPRPASSRIDGASLRRSPDPGLRRER